MTKRDGMTKAQRIMLELAVQFGGELRVFTDQFRIASKLEAQGFVTSDGKFLDRKIQITPAGRSALANAEKQS